ncbi:MAG TPA: hypothetical protein VEC38_02850 [Candidatus Binataceae bacterium]|nr:hypothetical protein [Candidatus Binataceae bacterium]
MIGGRKREASPRWWLLLRAARRGGYSLVVRSWIIVGAAAAALWCAGCVRAARLPPRVTVTEIEPSARAAKPPDCDMPVLRYEPLADFRKVAIIEGVGSIYSNEDEVLPLVRRKACETGADAIVVLASKRQTTESLVGYYIDSVAIIYGSNRNLPTAPSTSH